MAAMRTFSDDTLREARERLLARSFMLRDRVQRVRADLRHATEPLPPAAPGLPIVREDPRVLQAIEISANAELSRITSALDRMEDGTFGLCVECGHEIEATRFSAVPAATHCMACARVA
jgi:RNA polymerase-binding transcription factor DksA